MNLSKHIVADLTPTTSTRFYELYVEQSGIPGETRPGLENLNTHVIVLFHFQIL